MKNYKIFIMVFVKNHEALFRKFAAEMAKHVQSVDEVRLNASMMAKANPNESTPEKSDQKEVLSVTITASVTQDLYKRIDEILRAFAQKGRSWLESLLVRQSVKSSTIEEVLRNILNALKSSCEQNKQNFGEAVAVLHKRRTRANNDADKDLLQINIHNLTAQVDANLKANLSLNGGIGIKVRSLESEDKWTKLKQKVSSLLDNAEKTVTEIKDKGSIALTKAANAFEIIKQKGLRLVDEARETSSQVKGEIVQAYLAIENLLKTVDVAGQEIKVSKVSKSE